MKFKLPIFNEHQKEVKMAFAGDLQVIKNLLLKKKLLEQKDSNHKKIRTVAIFPGGGQRGVIHGGLAIAFEKLGLYDAFDYMIGISAGAALPYYGLAGEAALGTSIYFQENVEGKIFNFKKFWKIFDVPKLENVFRNIKPIDTEKLLSSRTKFLVVVTDKETGRARFVDVKSSQDPLSCFMASVSFPIASDIRGGYVVSIKGHECFDGCLGNPLPITYAIEHLGATDIFLGLTEPLKKDKDNTLLMNILDKTILRTLSPMARCDFEHWHERYLKELKYITGERKLPKGARIAVIYPEVTPVTSVTMDKELLENAAVRAMVYTEKIFSDLK